MDTAECVPYFLKKTDMANSRSEMRSTSLSPTRGVPMDLAPVAATTRPAHRGASPTGLTGMTSLSTEPEASRPRTANLQFESRHSPTGSIQARPDQATGDSRLGKRARVSPDREGDARVQPRRKTNPFAPDAPISGDSDDDLELRQALVASKRQAGAGSVEPVDAAGPSESRSREVAARLHNAAQLTTRAKLSFTTAFAIYDELHAQGGSADRTVEQALNALNDVRDAKDKLKPERIINLALAYGEFEANRSKDAGKSNSTILKERAPENSSYPFMFALRELTRETDPPRKVVDVLNEAQVRFPATRIKNIRRQIEPAAFRKYARLPVDVLNQVDDLLLNGDWNGAWALMVEQHGRIKADLDRRASRLEFPPQPDVPRPLRMKILGNAYEHSLFVPDRLSRKDFDTHRKAEEDNVNPVLLQLRNKVDRNNIVFRREVRSASRERILEKATWRMAGTLDGAMEALKDPESGIVAANPSELSFKMLLEVFQARRNGGLLLGARELGGIGTLLAELGVNLSDRNKVNAVVMKLQTMLRAKESERGHSAESGISDDVQAAGMTEAQSEADPVAGSADAGPAAPDESADEQAPPADAGRGHSPTGRRLS